MRGLGLCFMTTGDLPFADLWLRWLGTAVDQVGLFVHAHYPQAVFSPFRRHLIAEHVDTRHGWRYPHNGGARGIVALLRAALEDPRIEAVLVASDTTVPIRPLRLACAQLLDGRSWIACMPPEPPYPQRYELLRPCGIPKEKFLCTDQWVSLTRRHAQIVVDAAPRYMDAFEGVNAAAEHFAPTMLAMAGVDFATETHQETPVFADWSAGDLREFAYISAADLEALVRSGKPFARKFPESSPIRDHWDRLVSA